MVLGAPWWSEILNTDQVFSDLPLLPPHLMQLCIIAVSSGVLAPKAKPSCPAPAAVSNVCVRVFVYKENAYVSCQWLALLCEWQLWGQNKKLSISKAAALHVLLSNSHRMSLWETSGRRDMSVLQ